MERLFTLIPISSLDDLIVALRMYGARLRALTYESYRDPVFLFLVVLLAFGLLNCVLGYRLLRFWVMIFGFFVGSFAGYYLAGKIGVGSRMVYLAAALIGGLLVAIIAFLIYKAGIFLLGAGAALLLGLYFLQPRSSGTFFLCILAAVVIGILGIRFSRGIIIIMTSCLGGVLSAFAICKIARLAELPYAPLIAGGLAIIGMLLQFVTNRDNDEEEEDEESEEEEEYNQKELREPEEEYEDIPSEALPEFDDEDYANLDLERYDEADLDELLDRKLNRDR